MVITGAYSQVSENVMGFNEIIDEIKEAMMDMEGKEISRIASEITGKDISYNGDDLWEIN